MAVNETLDLVATAQQFQVEAAVNDVKLFGSGHINNSYVVTCAGTNGAPRYLLQRINTNIFRDPAALMGNIVQVTAHLREKLAETPDAQRRVLTLVPACSGHAWLQHADGTCWRMFRFIEGTITYDRVLSADQARVTARAFGSFQQQLADFPARQLQATIPHFHDTPLRFQAFAAAVQQDAAGRAVGCAAEIEFLLRREALARALHHAGLPERVTHNDTKLNNVLFDIATGEPQCVVDLDTVMPGLALHDVGDMVRTATCAADEDEQDLQHVSMQIPLYRALLEGYAECAGSFLTAAERESLHLAGPVITLEQALRFLTDHLQGDVYYRVAKPDHNLHRCRTQIRLLQSMEQQLAEMQALTAPVFAALLGGGSVEQKHYTQEKPLP